jgi:hypothetical protein
MGKNSREKKVVPRTRTSDKDVYFKTTFIKQNIKIILIAGVPLSQALRASLLLRLHLCAFMR